MRPTTTEREDIRLNAQPRAMIEGAVFEVGAASFIDMVRALDEAIDLLVRFAGGDETLDRVEVARWLAS